MLLKINNEFKQLIPPLTQEEFLQLEKNILSEGIREPIILWNDTIIDGHNRYEIACNHSLKYETINKEFENENQVIEWMILNQFGRRNLSAYQRSLLALKLKPVFEEKAKENVSKVVAQNNTEREKPDFQKSEKVEYKTINTTKELSKIANVSHDTIAKVQKIEEKATPEVKEQLSKGEVSINQAYKEIKAQEKTHILNNMRFYLQQIVLREYM